METASYRFQKATGFPLGGWPRELGWGVGVAAPVVLTRTALSGKVSDRKSSQMLFRFPLSIRSREFAGMFMIPNVEYSVCGVRVWCDGLTRTRVLLCKKTQTYLARGCVMNPKRQKPSVLLKQFFPDFRVYPSHKCSRVYVLPQGRKTSTSFMYDR